MHLTSMNVYLERLYHFKCDSCGQWWTIADGKITVGKKVFCPKCSHLHIVTSITIGEDTLNKEDTDE